MFAVGSYERVLVGVVSGAREYVNAPILEEAELLSEQNREEPPKSARRYCGAMCQK